MLMIDRMEDIAAGLSPEAAARVVGSRMEVFDITNVSDYMADDLSMDPFNHPSGPPFDLYWMEFRAPSPEARIAWGDGVGLLCIADKTPEGVPSMLVRLYTIHRKTVVGPMAGWLVEFPADQPPWVSVVEPVADSSIRRFIDKHRAPPEWSPREAFDSVMEKHPEWEGLPPSEILERCKETRDDLFRLAEEADEHARSLNRQIFTTYAFWWLRVLLGAHAFLACRNVSTDDVDPDPKLSAVRARKHGKPLVSYKVLRIDPMGTTRRSGSGGTPSDDDDKRALHIVRGHFKTFTDDRPLFGRVTGTYWWANQLRGNKDHGVVVKDYAMATPVAS